MLSLQMVLDRIRREGLTMHEVQDAIRLLRMRSIDSGWTEAEWDMLMLVF